MVTLLFVQLFCNNIFRFSVLFFFWNELNKSPIFTHLTHGKILQELFQFKQWNFFLNIQWVIIISHKFLIITQIKVIHSTCSQYFQFMNLKTLLNSLEWNENRKAVPFSLYALPRSSSLRICCYKIIVKIVVQPIA